MPRPDFNGFANKAVENAYVKLFQRIIIPIVLAIFGYIAIEFNESVKNIDKNVNLLTKNFAELSVAVEENTFARRRGAFYTDSQEE